MPRHRGRLTDGPWMFVFERTIQRVYFWRSVLDPLICPSILIFGARWWAVFALTWLVEFRVLFGLCDTAQPLNTSPISSSSLFLPYPISLSPDQTDYFRWSILDGLFSPLSALASNFSGERTVIRGTICRSLVIEYRLSGKCRLLQIRIDADCGVHYAFSVELPKAGQAIWPTCVRLSNLIGR